MLHEDPLGERSLGVEGRNPPLCDWVWEEPVRARSLRTRRALQDVCAFATARTAL